MSEFEVKTSFDEVVKNVTETLKNYFIVNHSKSLDEVSTVITVMVNNLKTLVTPNEPTQVIMEQLEEALKKHYKQKKVMIAERYKFFKRDQIKGESITSYVNDLKNLATTCLFGVFLEEALRDKLVCGMKDENIQADLLTKENLTFDYAYQYALTMEKLSVESQLLEIEKVNLNSYQPKLKNKKNQADVSTAESLLQFVDIKEELNPLEFQELLEAQQQIYDIKCEPRDNLQVEPINKSLERDKCDKRFTEKLISKNRITCKFCGKSFTRNYGLEKHLKVHASLKPFLCETCNDSFSSKEGLQQHVQGHTHVFRTYTCQHCDKQFAKKSKLQRHLRTHLKASEKETFSCEFCNKSFTRKYNLKHHLRSHYDTPTTPASQNDQSPEISRIYKCDTCNFTTKAKDSLRRHIFLHTGEKPFLCNVCDFRTARNGQLQVHLRMHTGVKPYKCEICNFKAASQSNLRNHKLTHSGEKHLVCEFCGYKTNYSTLLKTHLRTHTGEKPYACKICDYKSSDRSTLRNHLRTHTGEKPYSCKFCDYKAAQRTGLVYHLKTHKK